MLSKRRNLTPIPTMANIPAQIIGAKIIINVRSSSSTTTPANNSNHFKDKVRDDSKGKRACLHNVSYSPSHSKNKIYKLNPLF